MNQELVQQAAQERRDLRAFHRYLTEYLTEAGHSPEYIEAMLRSSRDFAKRRLMRLAKRYVDELLEEE